MDANQKRRQSALAQMLAQYGTPDDQTYVLKQGDIDATPQLKRAAVGDALRFEPFVRPKVEGGADTKMPNFFYRDPPQPDRKRGS